VGGIKLPTGDSGSIKTVAESVEEEEAHSARGAFDDLLPAVMHLPSSAGGGRALSLGSGSVDYIVGTTASARFDRLLISSVVQFTQRTEGDFDYRFANDLLWSFGPGFYLILEDRLTLALLFPVSGEHKGRDSLGSSIEKGTHLSNIYLGPELVLTAFDSLLAALSFDLPVSSDTAAAIVETDYRVRLSLNYRF